MKILLTSTSFQDTPGLHNEKLNNLKCSIDKLRGPLTAKQLLPIIHNYDGIICGDDDFNAEVLIKGKKGKLKVLSKYGIGLDKIDLKAAKNNNILVFNTPGVNHCAVAEHTFALLLSFEKNIIEENNLIKKNKWVRLIGNEIYKKKIGVFGLGSVGKEVVKRSLAFGMEVYAFDKYEDVDFIKKYKINFSSSLESFISKIDYMSLNLPLNEFTFHLINKNVLKKIKTNLVIINTARADLVDQNALLESIKNSKIRGYLTDVLEKEPMIKNHPLLNFKNVIITPHIGSRNYETVQRQGLRSVENLSNFLNL